MATLGIYILTFVDANPSFMPTVQDSNLDCDGGRYGAQLVVSDCLSAMSLLPTDEAGDVKFDSQAVEWIYPLFSNSAPEARHRLPKIRTFGSCNVGVSLYDYVLTDRSSWRILALRAGHVIDMCVRRQSGIGGGATTGYSKEIAVMVYSTKPELNALNLTLSLTNIADTTR